MTNRLEEFVQQARLARQRAAEADGEIRGQWERVAEMWEMLAKEHARMRPQKDAPP